MQQTQLACQSFSRLLGRQIDFDEARRIDDSLHLVARTASLMRRKGLPPARVKLADGLLQLSPHVAPMRQVGALADREGIDRTELFTSLRTAARCCLVSLAQLGKHECAVLTAHEAFGQIVLQELRGVVTRLVDSDFAQQEKKPSEIWI